jgi:hypothetical protein
MSDAEVTEKQLIDALQGDREAVSWLAARLESRQPGESELWPLVDERVMRHEAVREAHRRREAELREAERLERVRQRLFTGPMTLRNLMVRGVT